MPAYRVIAARPLDAPYVRVMSAWHPTLASALEALLDHQQRA